MISGHLLNKHFISLKTGVETALKNNEVPIAAIIVDKNNVVVATGINETVASKQIHTHAEINAINAFMRDHNTYSLKDHILVTTLEPCLMCLGATYHAQLDSVCYLVDSPDNGSFTKYENLYPIMYNKVGNKEQQKFFSEILKTFFKSIR